MKKMILMLIAMVTMASSAKAMTFAQAQQEALFLSDKMAYQQEALFLSDKMAYELNLSVQQYEAVYEINLDYMMALSVNDDIFGFYWERRNEDLSYVLSVYQYRSYMAREYFSTMSVRATMPPIGATTTGTAMATRATIRDVCTTATTPRMPITAFAHGPAWTVTAPEEMSTTAGMQP